MVPLLPAAASAASALSPSLSASVAPSIGDDGMALLRLVARQTGGSVPVSLLDDASWATPSFLAFAVAAVTFEIRRSLAASLRESLTDAQAASCFAPVSPLPVPAPDPDLSFDFVP